MIEFLKSTGLAIGLAVVAVPVLAQESTNRVFSKTDWGVFVEENPTQCWVVSAPKETVNTKGGRVVAVTRGDIRMFVSYWPGSGKLGEVSFASGYPFADGQAVTVKIGEANYEMFTEGETAWAAGPDDDKRIIAAMKRGAKAVVTGLSRKNTKTEDTFSLLGFTAAIEEAEKRCG